jgi:hypothetical protein
MRYQEKEAGGDWARDEYRGDLGGYYARDGGWSGGARRDDYVRDYRGLGPRNYRREDVRVDADVNEALTEAPDVDATHIDVSVNDGVVTLAGYVTSRDEKRAAEDVAWSCRGVRDVMNVLRVTTGDHEVEIGKAAE